jgi:hypothetical protein
MLAGRMFQFTYLGVPPVGPHLLRELGLRAHLESLAPLNFPPAFVYALSAQVAACRTEDHLLRRRPKSPRL